MQTFKEYLRELLLMSGKYQVANVVSKMNISMERHGLKPVALSTMYRYLEPQGTNFPVELLGHLYNATEDEVLNFVVKVTDKILAPRPDAGELKDLKGETLDVVASSGSLYALIIEAIRDNTLSEQESADVLAAINKNLTQLEELRQAVIGKDLKPII